MRKVCEPYCTKSPQELQTMTVQLLLRYLRLYSPAEGERLYARDAPRDRQKKHGASYSPVRVEHPDLEVAVWGR